MEMAERGQTDSRYNATDVSDNFITANMTMGESLQPCTCYGIIERKWAVTSNARFASLEPEKVFKPSF